MTNAIENAAKNDLFYPGIIGNVMTLTTVTTNNEKRTHTGRVLGYSTLERDEIADVSWVQFEGDVEPRLAIAGTQTATLERWVR